MDACNTRHQVRRAPQGFTLVELLTVVVIIGILAALITAAAIKAKDMAKTTAMKAEISQMALALDAFKQQFGDYPPDGTNATDTANFLRRAFPRYSGTLPGAPWPNLTPATALTYWLGGGTDNTGYTWLSANPVNPFDGSQSRIGPPPFEFDRTRVNNGQFYPNNGTGVTAHPFLYFKATGGTYSGAYSVAASSGTATTSVTPYVDTRLNNTPVNPRAFQIICPGMDGIFGTGNHFPTGSDYNSNNYDDITNFSNGKLENEMNN
jgi:prepilin-type N-terminal cleavage/methylation domain-containing protein